MTMKPRLIDATPIYERLRESEMLALKRVADTPSNIGTAVNPAYMRYSTQHDERTRFRHMISDAETVEAIPVEWILKHAEDRWIDPDVCDCLIDMWRGENEEDSVHLAKVDV